MALTAAQQQALTKLRTAGGSDLGVGLDTARLNYLLAIIVRDLERGGLVPELPRDIPGIYDRVDSERLRVEGTRFTPLFERLLEREPDSDTYLFCLGTLLKARLKYEKILRAQPIPTVEQVGPRSLLQFGQMESGALAAFLFWRKWIYDIDNRAGQEAGYLFEPIMAHSIGGVAYGARKSPIRRDGNGAGRQVDCVRERDDEKLAYEFKLRVTIAASGQGRWGEELSFPHDCLASGFKPILIVFDDTENEKLTALRREFETAGGESHVGADAWEHLEQEAGPTMSRFLENYVRGPINEILESAPEALPQITLSMDEGVFRVLVGGDELIVPRADADPNAMADLLAEADRAAECLPDDVDEG